MEIRLKTMPKTRYAILRKRLLDAIDDNSDDYTALPKLRCMFGEQLIVSDVAVIAWNRIQINEVGEPEDDFTEAPDWTIEILSPDQKATRVIDNILHCLQHGCRLGWMLDPDDYSILILTPHQEPGVYRGDRQLPVLEGVNLTLTVEQVFGWLKIARR
jgi:Uma2 family endonuclease